MTQYQGFSVGGHVTPNSMVYRGWKKFARKIPLIRRWIKADGIELGRIVSLEFSLVRYHFDDERYGVHPVQVSGMRAFVGEKEPFYDWDDEWGDEW